MDFLSGHIQAQPCGIQTKQRTSKLNEFNSLVVPALPLWWDSNPARFSFSVPVSSPQRPPRNTTRNTCATPHATPAQHPCNAQRVRGRGVLHLDSGGVLHPLRFRCTCCALLSVQNWSKSGPSSVQLSPHRFTASVYPLGLDPIWTEMD